MSAQVPEGGNRPLIITGMHRSGSSLVASLLQRAGLDLGHELIGADRGNPRGHFEDAEIVRLHDRWLAPAGRGILVDCRDLLPQPDGDWRAQADRLVAARSGRPRWGFKDPRASMFLDLWAERLPDARFLLLYRHPLEVALSLIRRGTDIEAVADPLAGLRSWTLYNRSILRFRRRHRPRSLLCDIEAVVEDLDRFFACVEGLLGAALPASGGAELVHRSELSDRVRGRRVEPLLQRLVPEVTSLHRELIAVSDLRPAPSQPSGSGEPLLAAMEGLLDSAPATDGLRRPLIALLLAALDPEISARAAAAGTEHRANLESHRRHAENLEVQLAAVGRHPGLEAARAVPHQGPELLPTPALEPPGDRP